MGDLGRGGGEGNKLGLSEAIGEKGGRGGGGGGRGSLSGPGVVGGVGGRTEKVGGMFGGRKDRLGGLGGGIGFRLEMDFASSLTGIFCCSAVGSFGSDPRLRLSVRCCCLSDLPRPIRFLEWANRGIG